MTLYPVPEKQAPDDRTPEAPLAPLGVPADGPIRRDANPVLAYLARLAPGSRRTMRGALENVAWLASGGEIGAPRVPVVEARAAPRSEVRMPATTNHRTQAVFQLGVLPTMTRMAAAGLRIITLKKVVKNMPLSELPG